MIAASVVTALCYLYFTQYWNLFFWYWLLPSRLAVLFLGFAFDYLPHFPHDYTPATNRWLTTALLRLPGAQRVLTFVLLCQDYHLIHHLWPTIPFYRYPKAYELRKEQLKTHKVRERNIWNMSYSLLS